MNIGIYIYDQAEVLDFSGPFEVFSVASRVSDGDGPFSVFLVGQSGGTVTARGGYRVVPDYGFDDHPGIDVLIVVGGVHDREMGKPEVVAWLAAQARRADIVASVCTGAFLLAQAEVLEGEKVTTHWAGTAALREQFPRLEVIENVRWVDAGRRVTSGGITAGIDMSLHLVRRLAGAELAQRTARQMAFGWTREP